MTPHPSDFSAASNRRLILIRHSLSRVEPGVPVALWRLSPEGVARARRFAARVDPGSAERVFTSPEPKAAQTARLLASAWCLPVEEVTGLHEHQRPDARMLPADQFEERVRAVLDRPFEVVFGSESGEAALFRFDSAVSRLIDRTAGDVVIVSHGTVMALFVAKHTGADAYEFWKRQEMPFAATLELPTLNLVKVTFLSA